MGRWTQVMAVLLLGVGLSVAQWLMSRTVMLPPVASAPAPMAEMPGMEMGNAPQPGAKTPGEMPTLSPEEVLETVTIPPDRLQTIGVKYEPVTRRALTKVIRTVGRVTADERRLAKVTIKFHGWIEQLFVSATGDHVKKGQALFTIYSPDLVATQEEYLLALQGRRQLGESEFPEVARSSKDLLEAARHRLHLWDIREEHIRELEQTGQVLKTLPMHSPITGTVIRKEALAGAHVEPGEELYTIADLSQVWIIADIYEYELGFAKKGQKAAVTLSYDPKTRLTGRVEFIYPTLDPKTRTANVRFVVDNAQEKLKPDMYANIELQVRLGTRLAVPQDAVIESGQRQLVFLHHGGGRLEPRVIQTGAKTSSYYEVVSGLKEGDHIVTSANFLVDSESRLKAVVDSMGGMAGMKKPD